MAQTTVLWLLTFVLGAFILAQVALGQTSTPTATPSPTTSVTATPTQGTTSTPTPTGSVQGSSTVPGGAPATGHAE